MKKYIATFLIAFSLLMHTNLSAQINELPRSTPEEQGVPSEAIIALFDSLNSLPKTEIHSVMVIRHGKVIGEIYPHPFAPEYQHTMYSCSKTFVAAAVGLAIADNRIRLNDRVGAFLPEALPDSVSDNLADMTIRNLLTMTSGITPDWNMRNQCSNWMHTYLSKPVKKTGVKFEYDSIATYLLSAIVQKTTGMTLLEYLRIKLFQPMNITEVAWELSPEGINTGGWGLHIQSESLAKFGLLLLNNGIWEGKQLLPASWVKQMMSKQMEAGSEDYGYQMWLCDYPGAVRADGALGQYILIIPEKDMVVVMTECTLINGSRQRNIVWNQLLPKIQEHQLAPNKMFKQLKDKQKSYMHPILNGKSNSREFLAYEQREILLESNKYGWKCLKIECLNKEIKLHIQEENGNTFTLPLGYKQWITTELKALPPYSIQPKDCFKGLEGPFFAAGNYAWTTPNMLQVKIHYVNWVSSLKLTFSFEGSQIKIEISENFSPKQVVLIGKI